MNGRCVSALLAASFLASTSHAFTARVDSSKRYGLQQAGHMLQPPQGTSSATLTTLFATGEGDDRNIRLREEAESPFRKIRFFVYFNLLGGALTSLFVSTARIAAAASGVNADLMDESLVNAAVERDLQAGRSWGTQHVASDAVVPRTLKGALCP